MTQEKRILRVRDDYGGYTLEGLWQISRPLLEKECKKAGMGAIGRNEFSQIVREYFELSFNYAIYRYREVDVYLRFGRIYVYKVLCTVATPKGWRKVKNEVGEWINERYTMDVNSQDGYFYQLHWDLPRKYQRYKYKKITFKLARRWKRKVYQAVKEGNDYPDRAW